MIRCLGRIIHKAMGWELEGHFPSELAKKILIVAPHTSFMDFFVGIPVKFWLDIQADWYGKKELFIQPFGWILKAIGGNPIDRQKHSNTVSQIVHNFNTREKHTILLTPEGTRKKVSRFKTGFYQIAVQSGVPIIPLIFDYRTKKIKILDPIYPNGEDGELENIESLFRGYQGKNAALSF